jgi:hypothetical protein
MKRSVDCGHVRDRLPGYLDGSISSREHAPIGVHLDSCAECRQELQRYRKLSQLMSRVERAVPPAGLAFKVRNAISSARNAVPWRTRLRDRAGLILDNMLKPAMPATGGALGAMAVFLLVLQNMFLGIPLGAVPNDVPTNLIQPPRLESLANFPVAGDDWLLEESGARVLVVEARVDARGQAVGYDILAGPDNPEVRRQLDQVILFSRFRPAMNFGHPIGGRLVLNLTEIRVKG